MAGVYEDRSLCSCARQGRSLSQRLQGVPLHPVSKAKPHNFCLSGKGPVLDYLRHQRWLSEWNHKKCCTLFPVKPYSGEKNKSYCQTSKKNWENGCLDFQVLSYISVFLLSEKPQIACSTHWAEFLAVISL